MRHGTAVAVALVALVCMPAAADAFMGYSMQWGKNGELWKPKNRLLDWSFAGYRQGNVPLPAPPATRSVTDFRKPGGSDTQMFQDALAWAHAQPVDPAAYLVLTIPAGTYSLTDILAIKRSRMVLRGAGMGQTILDVGKSLTDLFGRSNDTDTGGWVNWGGFITVSGKSWRGQQVALVAAPAQRGDYSVIVNDASKLRVGQYFDLWWLDSKGRFNDIMMDGKAKAPSQFADRLTSKLGSKIVGIAGNRVTLERPLAYPIKWGVNRVTLHAIPDTTTTEVGVEGITFSFKHELYAGHHLERGWNGIEFRQGVRDSWAQGIELVNPDNGITVKNIRIRYTAPRGNNIPNKFDEPANSDGHWGIVYSGSYDFLATDFEFDGVLQHDVGTGFGGQFGVFSNGKLRDGNLDLHRGLAGPTLYTNIDVGLGSKALASGGPTKAGPNTVAGSTWWGIWARQAVDANKSNGKPGDCAFGPSILLVGVNLKQQSVRSMCASWWYERDVMSPLNIHEAQLQRRLAGRT